MSQVTIKGFVHYRRDDCLGEDLFSIFSLDMSNYGYVLVGEREFTVDIPDDFNPVPRQIEVLEHDQERILADANEKINAIQERISKLRALEHKQECDK